MDVVIFRVRGSEMVMEIGTARYGRPRIRNLGPYPTPPLQSHHIEYGITMARKRPRKSEPSRRMASFRIIRNKP